jgi:Spy/CpxP family protein refolding chaperone
MIRTVVGAALLFACGTLSAQGAAQRSAADSGAANRAALEQQVRDRIAAVTRDRLGATDDQMAKLQETNKKFDEQRRVLVDQERATRIALRMEMKRGDPGGRVAPLLDKVNGIQQQRAVINQQEQRELAGYLTPLQRAKYFALEQQVRQRVQQMRQSQQFEKPDARTGRGGVRGARVPPPARGRGVQRPMRMR